MEPVSQNIDGATLLQAESAARRRHRSHDPAERDGSRRAAARHARCGLGSPAAGHHQGRDRRADGRAR